MRFYFLFLCALMFVFPGSAIASKNLDSAYRTALALNYAHAALYTITEFNDRVVLDHEYKNILSNINLSQIEDKEVILLLQGLLDTLNKFLLTEQERILVDSLYKEKIENAFYSANTSAVNNSLILASSLAFGNYFNAFFSISTIGDQAISYREKIKDYRISLDRELWELSKAQSNALNELRKQFLMNYWQLMRKYDIPDKWRITEDQFSRFLDVLKDDDLSRKHRRLERMKTQFEAYPPFWYYYGKVTQEIKFLDEAILAYDYFIKNHVEYFRNDDIFSSVLLNRIMLYTPSERDKIETLLQKIIEVSPLDGRKMLAVALYYAEIKKYHIASKLLQSNIDEGFMVPLNLRILAEINAEESPASNNQKYHEIILSMMKKDDFKNDTILYLIGKRDEDELLSSFFSQVKDISIEYRKRFLLGDLLVLTFPVKWIMHDGDVVLSKVMLDDMRHNSISFNSEQRTVSFMYSNFTSIDNFPGKYKPLKLRFNLSGMEIPLTFIFEYYVVEEGSDKIAKFEYVNLMAGDKCYKIEDSKLIPGC